MHSFQRHNLLNKAALHPFSTSGEFLTFLHIIRAILTIWWEKGPRKWHCLSEAQESWWGRCKWEILCSGQFQSWDSENKMGLETGGGTQSVFLLSGCGHSNPSWGREGTKREHVYPFVGTSLDAWASCGFPAMWTYSPKAQPPEMLSGTLHMC